MWYYLPKDLELLFSLLPMDPRKEFVFSGCKRFIVRVMNLSFFFTNYFIQVMYVSLGSCFGSSKIIFTGAYIESLGLAQPFVFCSTVLSKYSAVLNQTMDQPIF